MQCKQPQWEMSDTSYQELLSINSDPTVKFKSLQATVSSIHWLQQGHTHNWFYLKIFKPSGFKLFLLYHTNEEMGWRIWLPFVGAGIWPQPIHSMFTSTISAFAPEQAQHHQQVKLFGKQRGKKLKLGICWAIASRVEQFLTATVGFTSSGLVYLSNFLLRSMARNKSRRWFITLRMAPMFG